MISAFSSAAKRLGTSPVLSSESYLHDLGLLVGGEEVGHLAGIEQRVDVLEEALLLDLRVGDEEGGVTPLRAAVAQ